MWWYIFFSLVTSLIFDWCKFLYLKLWNIVVYSETHFMQGIGGNQSVLYCVLSNSGQICSIETAYVCFDLFPWSKTHPVLRHDLVTFKRPLALPETMIWHFVKQTICSLNEKMFSKPFYDPIWPLSWSLNTQLIIAIKVRRIVEFQVQRWKLSKFCFMIIYISL